MDFWTWCWIGLLTSSMTATEKYCLQGNDITRNEKAANSHFFIIIMIYFQEKYSRCILTAF